MSYCQTCGKEIDDKARHCPYCGSRAYYEVHEEQDQGLAIAALVLAFIIPLIGFILGCIGLSQYKRNPNRGMCIAAIVLPCVFIALIILIIPLEILILAV